MAKALFGHVGGPDPRIEDHRDLHGLAQQRDVVWIADPELVRLQQENDSLTVEAAHENMLVAEREPALV